MPRTNYKDDAQGRAGDFLREMTPGGIARIAVRRNRQPAFSSLLTAWSCSNPTMPPLEIRHHKRIHHTNHYFCRGHRSAAMPGGDTRSPPWQRQDRPLRKIIVDRAGAKIGVCINLQHGYRIGSVTRHQIISSID